MLRIALDSNVILSGLFFEGNEGELLVAGLTGHYRIVLSREIMAEVSDVVERKFKGSDKAARARDFLEDLKLAAEPHRRPYPKPAMRKAKALMRDADDVIHAAFVLAARPDMFVSGDKDFLSVKNIGLTPVVTTRKALEMLRNKKKR